MTGFWFYLHISNCFLSKYIEFIYPSSIVNYFYEQEGGGGGGV